MLRKAAEKEVKRETEIEKNNESDDME